MNALDLLFAVSLGTTILALLVSVSGFGRMLLTAAYGVQLVILLQINPTRITESMFTPELLGHTLGWQVDGLSWFFILITLVSALVATWYDSGEYGNSFRNNGGSCRLLHVGLGINVFAMLLLLASADWLSLFIGWELVSWAGVLLMVLGGRPSQQAAIRYITYAFGGGLSVFAALMMIYAWTGSLAFSNLADAGLQGWQPWLLVLLLIGGFAVKMGLLPFHLWQAPAYALTAGPASVFLGAISARMGLFAIVVVLVKVITLEQLIMMEIIPGYVNARDILAFIAALTIILPTYTALRQTDARLLLAWHGIGQGGYMLLGLLMTSSMGSAGGLLHVINYAACQAALLMSVFAIMHRTGTADLNRLGGLFTRMPLTFLVMLFGIIGLAGLPPMNGFVSKWMVYRSLLNEGMPLLFLMSVIGTLGTILSVYKLIHNSFLGQLRIEHEQIAEVPWSMMVPMLLLAGIIFITGFMPGLVLEYVAIAQQAINQVPVEFFLGGIRAADSQVGGDLDMIWVVSVLFAGFAIAAVLFLSTGRSRRVHQLDNYAGGHFLTAKNQYHYSDDFYAGLMHLIRGWYRGSFQWLESAVISIFNHAAGLLAAFIRPAGSLLWMLAGSTVLMFWLVM